MTAKTANRHPETLALHGGLFRSDPVTGACRIYLTTSYQFRDSEHARVFLHSRNSATPTHHQSDARSSGAARGGAGGRRGRPRAGTGTAASLYALLNLAWAGDNVIISADVASGRNAGLLASLRQLGIDASRHSRKAGTFLALTDDRTRAYYAESLSVPELRLFPIAEVAQSGLKAGIPLIIDNTALPLTCRPLDLGAAIVVYSAAEYLGGHATTAGGLIVDSGKFPWAEHAARFPSLTEPDDSYHGVIWTEVVKKWNAAPFVPRTRAHLLRDFGAAINPMAVFQLIQGIETLPLRIRRHNANARRIAAYLENILRWRGLQPDTARCSLSIFRARPPLAASSTRFGFSASARRMAMSAAPSSLP